MTPPMKMHTHFIASCMASQRAILTSMPCMHFRWNRTLTLWVDVSAANLLAMAEDSETVDLLSGLQKGMLCRTRIDCSHVSYWCTAQADSACPPRTVCTLYSIRSSPLSISNPTRSSNSEQASPPIDSDIRVGYEENVPEPRPRVRGTGKLLSSTHSVGLALMRLEHVDLVEKGILKFRIDDNWKVSHWWPEWWPRRQDVYNSQ